MKKDRAVGEDEGALRDARRRQQQTEQDEREHMETRAEHRWPSMVIAFQAMLKQHRHDVKENGHSGGAPGAGTTGPPATINGHG